MLETSPLLTNRRSRAGLWRASLDAFFMDRGTMHTALRKAQVHVAQSPAFHLPRRRIMRLARIAFAIVLPIPVLLLAQHGAPHPSAAPHPPAHGPAPYHGVPHT